jgi:hypothetical protein
MATVCEKMLKHDERRMKLGIESHHIVIVEDDPVTRREACRPTSPSKGYRVSEAEDGDAMRAHSSLTDPGRPA